MGDLTIQVIELKAAKDSLEIKVSTLLYRSAALTLTTVWLPVYGTFAPAPRLVIEALDSYFCPK